MKRLILVLCLTFLLVCVGCGKQSDSISKDTNQSNNKKGSRSDPYRVGEEVVLKDVCDMSGDYKDVKLDVTFTISKTFTVEEGAKITNHDNTFASWRPVAIVDLHVDGDYDNRIDYSSCDAFEFVVINDKMEEDGAIFETLDLDQASYFTGVDYQFYIGANYDNNNSTGEEAKYIEVNYKGYNENGDSYTDKVYIELD